MTIPAGDACLWLGCSDRALVRTCDAAIAAAALACWGCPFSLLLCWALCVVLTAVVPMVQYPWDLLLMEAREVVLGDLEAPARKQGSGRGRVPWRSPPGGPPGR